MNQRPLSSIEEDDAFFDTFYRLPPTFESPAENADQFLSSNDINDPKSTNLDIPSIHIELAPYSPYAHYASVNNRGGPHRPRFNSDHSDFTSDVMLGGEMTGSEMIGGPEGRGTSNYADYSEIGHQYETLSRSARSRDHARRSRVPLTRYSTENSRKRTNRYSKSSDRARDRSNELKYSHPYSVIETSAIRRGRRSSTSRDSRDGGGGAVVTSRDRRAGSLTSVQSRNRYNLSGSKYSVNGTGTISRSRKNSYATYRSVSHYRAVSVRTKEIVVMEEEWSKTVMMGRRVLTAVSFILYIQLIALFIVFATSSPNSGLFETSLTIAFEAQETKLQPTAGYYAAYALIYIWNLIWILWSVSAICLLGQHDQNDPDDDSCFRQYPTVLTISFFCHFSLFILSLSIWFFLVDLQYGYGCLWILILALLSIISACVSLIYNFRNQRDELIENFGREFWILKMFVQNGLSCIPFLLLFELCNFVNYLVVVEGGSSEVAINVLLTLVCIVLIIYSACDFLLLEEILRFVVSPYLTSIWYGINLLAKNIENDEEKSSNEDDSQLLVFCIAICIVSLVLLLLRLFHACYQVLSNDDLSEVGADLPPERETSEHEMSPKSIRYENDQYN